LDLFEQRSDYVSSVVFYFIDWCNLLPVVHHKNDGRGYPDVEQESIEADAV